MRKSRFLFELFFNISHFTFDFFFVFLGFSSPSRCDCKTEKVLAHDMKTFTWAFPVSQEKPYQQTNTKKREFCVRRKRKGIIRECNCCVYAQNLGWKKMYVAWNSSNFRSEIDGKLVEIKARKHIVWFT